jgi:hypothetical protein
MSAFDAFAPTPPARVTVDVYTTSYRVSGTTPTRHSRVVDILNQLPGALLTVEEATVTEYAAPSGPMSAPQVLIPAERIVLMVAPQSSGEPRSEMRIQKRPVRAELLVPPFRVVGSFHVPQGSRAIDGLLNAVDWFLAMTEVVISSNQYPSLGGSFDVIAIQRSLAHLIVAADDERPDELLAEVLDETTAHDWIHGDQEIG